MNHPNAMGQGIKLENYIRDIPDFPKPGIIFKDITPLLQDPVALKVAIHRISEPFLNKSIDLVIGPDARGFIFAPAIAYHLNAGFIPVRKAGKLPHRTRSIRYALEYGQNELFIHEDAIQPGDNVLIVDDLLATGGTADATCKLTEDCGGRICGLAFIIELSFLNGREKVCKYPLHTLIRY